MDRRTLYSDIDDTLIMHNLSEYPRELRITIACNGRVFEAVPNQKNINTLVKFYNLGYEICVWSRTGKSWAQAVGEKLNVSQYVSHYLTKPDFILDDKEANEWIGPRIYRA